MPTPTSELAVAQAEALHANGQFERELSVLNEALLDNPAHDTLLSMRVWALWALDRNQEALEATESILADQPWHANSMLARGWLLSNLARGDEALAQAERSVEAHPNSSSIHHLLSVMIYRYSSAKGRMARSVYHATTALELRPSDPEIIAFLITLSKHTKTPMTTIDYLRYGLSQYPDDPIFLAETSKLADPTEIVDDLDDALLGALAKNPQSAELETVLLGRILRAARHACWMPASLAGLFLIFGPSRNPFLIGFAAVIALILLAMSASVTRRGQRGIPADVLVRELKERPGFSLARTLCWIANPLAFVGLTLFLAPSPAVGISAVALLFLVALTGIIAVQLANRGALHGHQDMQDNLVRHFSARNIFAVLALLAAPFTAREWAPAVLMPWVTLAAGIILLTWAITMFVRDWLRPGGARWQAIPRLLENLRHHRHVVLSMLVIPYVVVFEVFRLGIPIFIILRAFV